jgi:phospholipase C
MAVDGSEQADANLAKVDHVVVMMLENRSFDHILGYLPLTGERSDIDGLRPGLANSYQGRSYPVHHLDGTALQLDPDHSSDAIDQQIAGGSMDGFVTSAAATLAKRGVGDGDPGCVMGYYDGADVPVYDHLAEEFAICDRWFSSVAGATLPNRLYGLCGAAAGSRDDRPEHVPPLYHQPSFVRHLDAARVPWRWYSFDPGTLRLADAHYLLGHHDRFGYFSKTGLPWRAVFGFPVNDDHPPADIKDGQDLVLAAYDALAASPQWETSLLAIVYDEHGGFYDHVPPPRAADDEPETFGSYGVRVPAIIVSPWIEPRAVSHTLFDHTSLIKTILLRFCPGALHEPPPADRQRPRLGLGPQYPGLRTARASHLGELLTRGAPRPAPRRDALLQQATARAAPAETSQPPPGSPGPGDPPLNDLQKSILTATRELRRRGHPPNTP